MIGSKSRTEKAMLNSTITLMCQIFYLVSSFICRTIFTHILGKEYVGINGLFSNIFMLLSFADMGLGSALVYRLYEPIAKNDIIKISMYLHLYKRIYRIIVAVITMAGISFLPFLNYLIQMPDIKERVLYIYILYLLDVIISYTYIYKKAILIADQRTYIINIITEIFNTVINISQIFVLIVSHNFIMYCLVRSFFLLMSNFACAFFVDRQYPYVYKKIEERLNKEEKAGLKKDAKGLLLTKIASEAFGGTDNIFITKFIGLGYVGILSNYTLLLSTINTIMNRIFQSVTASIGNLAVIVDRKRTEEVLNKLFFLNVLFYGYVCIGMSFLLKEFVMDIWLTKEYFLTDYTINLVIIEVFIRCIHYPVYNVRQALGAFSQYKMIFVITAVVNIILDFIFIRPFGIAGLIISTIFCRGITYFSDIAVVYGVLFEKSVMQYFRMFGKWLLFLTIVWKLIKFILPKLTLYGIYGFIIKIILITIIYFGLFIIVFKRTEEFKYYTKLFKNTIHKLKCNIYTNYHIE